MKPHTYPPVLVTLHYVVNASLPSTAGAFTRVLSVVNVFPLRIGYFLFFLYYIGCSSFK